MNNLSRDFKIFILLIITIFCLVMLIVIIGFGPRKSNPKEDWEKCASSFPVLESNPEQCNDGTKTYWGPPEYRAPKSEY